MVTDYIPQVPPIYQTQLAFELDPADLTMTIASELLISGVSLSGLVGFSIDIGQPNPEYVVGTLSGTTFTFITRNCDPLNPNVSLGTFGSIHRQGAVVKITDFVTIEMMRNILNGTANLQNVLQSPNNAVNATDVPNFGQLQSAVISGAIPASMTELGLVRLTSSPNIVLGNPTIMIASPAVITLASHGLTVNDIIQFSTTGTLPTGITAGTTYYVISIGLTTNSFEISSTAGGAAINMTGSQLGVQTLTKITPIALSATDYRLNGNNYGESTTGNDTYVITLTNAPTIYVKGQQFFFKGDTANTGSCTININGLGAKSLKVNGNLDPQDNYIKIGQTIGIEYDGTNMQIFSVAGKPSVSQTGEEIYAATATGNDTYVINVQPIPAAYVNGMTFRFKTDVANTGAASLNVNTLGAITIVKNQNVALADNDIKAGQIVEVSYDGTNFQMLSPIANLQSFGSTGGVSAGPTASSTQTITHGLGRIPAIIRLHGIGTLVVNGSGGNASESHGTWNSTGNRSVFIPGGIGLNESPQTDTTNAINLYVGGGNSAAGVVGNVLLTTFDIVWTNTGGSVATTVFHWEAQ